MKNNRKIYILSFIGLILVVCLSCFLTFKSFSRKIENIELIYNEDAIIQEVSNYRIDLFAIDIYYDDGNVQRKIVNESMVSKEDLQKLETVGLHEITIEYKKYKNKCNIYLYNKENINDSVFLLYNLDKLCVTNDRKLLDAPEKDGYYFAGWYIDEDCQELYTGSFDEKELQVLYAAWSRKPIYVVRFMLNESTCLKEEKVVEGASATPPSVASGDKQIFVGWDKPFNNVTSDLTVYAVFTVPVVEVFYYTKDNNILAHFIIEKGTSSTPPIAPEVEGFAFVGWSKDGKNLTEDTHIYPIYKENEYINYYASNKTTLLYTLPVSEEPPIPEQLGWRFNKWVEFIHPNTKQKSYYASFAELNAKVKLVLEDEYIMADGTIKDSIDLTVKKQNISASTISKAEIGDAITSTDYYVETLDYNFISHVTGLYPFYRWFLDEERLTEVDLDAYINYLQTDNDALKQDYIIYGEKLDNVEAHKDMFYYILNEDGESYSVKYNSEYNPSVSNVLYSVVIPSYYNGKKVTGILSLDVLSNAVVYIPSTIKYIDHKNINLCSGYVVDKENEYYESYDGVLLDIKNSEIIKMVDIENRVKDIFIGLYPEALDILLDNDNIMLKELKGSYNVIGESSFDGFWCNRNNGAVMLELKDGIKIKQNAFINNTYVYLSFLGDVELINYSEFVQNNTGNSNFFGLGDATDPNLEDKLTGDIEFHNINFENFEMIEKIVSVFSNVNIKNVTLIVCDCTNFNDKTEEEKNLVNKYMEKIKEYIVYTSYYGFKIYF